MTSTQEVLQGELASIDTQIAQLQGTRSILAEALERLGSAPVEQKKTAPAPTKMQSMSAAPKPQNKPAPVQAKSSETQTPPPSDNKPETGADNPPGETQESKTNTGEVIQMPTGGERRSSRRKGVAVAREGARMPRGVNSNGNPARPLIIRAVRGSGSKGLSFQDIDQHIIKKGAPTGKHALSNLLYNLKKRGIIDSDGKRYFPAKKDRNQRASA